MANLVMYDRDALRRQGVDNFREIEAQIRWNWSEMLSIAQQLTIDRMVTVLLINMPCQLLVCCNIASFIKRRTFADRDLGLVMPPKGKTINLLRFNEIGLQTKIDPFAEK